MGYWKKVGKIQKGKIFTVYSNETFDLRWYTDNIAWENPIVIGQVSSIFLDRWYTGGFKAEINRIDSHVYTARALSNSVIYRDTGFSSWMIHVNNTGDPNVYGGGWIYNGQIHGRGRYRYIRGFEFQYYHVVTEYDYHNTHGVFDIRINGGTVSTYSINRVGYTLYSVHTLPTYSGDVDIVFRDSNMGRTRYNLNVLISDWEVKSGILTIYANESNGG